MQKGDWVECVDARKSGSGLIQGEMYQVEGFMPSGSGEFVQLVGGDGEPWSASRFVLRSNSPAGLPSYSHWGMIQGV